MKKINSKLPLGRTLPTIVLMVMILFVFLVSSLGQGNNGLLLIIGRSIVVIGTTLFVSFAIYELLKAFTIHWFVTIIFILILIATLFVDFPQTRIAFDQNTQYKNLPLYLQRQFLNWPIYLLWILAILTVVVFYSLQKQTFNNAKNDFEKQMKINKKQNTELAFNVMFSNVVVIAIAFFLLIFFYRGFLAIFLTRWEVAILLMGVPIVSDTSGYFIGGFFGRKFIDRPLAPFISPSKTYEGAIASIIFSTVFIQSVYWGLSLQQSFYFSSIGDQASLVTLPIYLTLVLPFMAIIGDLAFSYIKRVNNIKDYSKILMKHGGILDRIDGNIFVNFAILLAFAFY